MAMFSVKFEGLEKALNELGSFTDKVILALESALFIEGEQTIAEAKMITPVDEGVLRASGFVQLPERDGDKVFVDIGFGGPAGTGNHGGETNDDDVGYAIIQHEDLTFFHTVGQAKYLEVPLNKRKVGYSARMAKRIKAKL